MNGFLVPHYATHSIRHNGQEFKMGHRFSAEELKMITPIGLERLIKNGAVTTDREKVVRKISLIAENEKKFKLEEDAYRKNGYRP